jgi:hypothetical protein
MRKTNIKILIESMRILSREIYCEDGVATAAIAEAAERLDELNDQLADQSDLIRKLKLDIEELEERLKDGL